MLQLRARLVRTSPVNSHSEMGGLLSKSVHSSAGFALLCGAMLLLCARAETTPQCDGVINFAVTAEEGSVIDEIVAEKVLEHTAS